MLQNRKARLAALRNTGAALALIAMTGPATASAIKCFSQNMSFDWENGGISYDYEQTFVDSMTGSLDSLTFNTTGVLGNTFTMGGLRDGNLSTSFFNPYLRLQIEASTPPQPDPHWQLSGALGLYGDLDEFDRSYAFFRGGVSRGYLEFFYEARYEFDSRTYSEETTVGLLGVCTRIEFFRAGPASGFEYNCDFDTIEFTIETSQVPLPAGAGLLASGVIALAGTRRLSRRS